MQDQCFWDICFFRLTGQEPKLFGFAEYLSALALMVLAWTIADFRYRFRVRVAPVPLKGLTFAMVAGVGILALATDLWRAERWYVPRGTLISSGEWQAFLGAMLLITFLTWSWFAFIRPQSFGRSNAFRYARAVYQTMLKGNPTEISIIADEIAFSARAIVASAPQIEQTSDGDAVKLSPLEEYSQDILLLMGDRRFCRALVGSSPGTILAIFDAIEKTRNVHAPLQPFARNLINEAILNRDSFVYHEEEGYKSGLMGYYKPLSQAIFSNYDIVEALGTLLDPDVPRPQSWEAVHWEAYGRLMLLTLKGYVEKRGFQRHSYVLHRAFSNISHSCLDLHELNGSDGSIYNDDRAARLRVAVDLLKGAIAILNDSNHSSVKRRITERNRYRGTIHDVIAECIVELIKEAASVKNPRARAWWIQHNSLWNKFFNFDHTEGAAAEIIKFKVRRSLYDEIRQMEKFADYQAAAVLGFLLNVMGVNLSRGDHDRDSRALHKAVLNWTKRNFLKMHRSTPSLAEACLLDGLEFDETNSRISRRYGLTPIEKPRYAYLELDPISADPELPK